MSIPALTSSSPVPAIQPNDPRFADSKFRLNTKMWAMETYALREVYRLGPVIGDWHGQQLRSVQHSAAALAHWCDVTSERWWRGQVSFAFGITVKNHSSPEKPDFGKSKIGKILEGSWDRSCQIEQAHLEACRKHMKRCAERQKQEACLEWISTHQQPQIAHKGGAA